MIYIKRLVLTIMFLCAFTNVNAENKIFNMVFVPASEKGDESDYTGLIEIVEELTGFEINTIKVTDYNAAVEAMRAGRAHIAWYGGKTYIKAAEIADAEAFAAGVRPGERTAIFIEDVLTKLTTIGALYLTLVCLMPEFLIAKYPIPFYLGGTSVLIVVVVAMDTVSQIQTRMMSQQYEALIKKTKFGR